MCVRANVGLHDVICDTGAMHVCASQSILSPSRRRRLLMSVLILRYGRRTVFDSPGLLGGAPEFARNSSHLHQVPRSALHALCAICVDTVWRTGLRGVERCASQCSASCLQRALSACLARIVSTNRLSFRCAFADHASLCCAAWRPTTAPTIAIMPPPPSRLRRISCRICSCRMYVVSLCG